LQFCENLLHFMFVDPPVCLGSIDHGFQGQINDGLDLFFLVSVLGHTEAGRQLGTRINSLCWSWLLRAAVCVERDRPQQCQGSAADCPSDRFAAPAQNRADQGAKAADGQRITAIVVAENKLG
jgi:hypothetical protein